MIQFFYKLVYELIQFSIFEQGESIMKFRDLSTKYLGDVAGGLVFKVAFLIDMKEVERFVEKPRQHKCRDKREVLQAEGKKSSKQVIV